MFDSVLSKSKAPQGNIAGLGLTVAVSVAVVLTVLLLPSPHAKQSARPVDVTFMMTQPNVPGPQTSEPPPAAAAAPPAQTQPQPKKPIKKKEVIKEPTPVVPEPTPTPVAAPQPAAAPEPATTPGVEGGVQGGVQGGVVGGKVGGVVGGVIGGTGTGTTAMPFGAGMTRPTQIAGKTPEYSREAMAARVEGKLLVRCVITVRGTVEDCKIIKGLPMLDKITVDALTTSRFTPVTYQGRPVSVQYLFTFNFKLP